MQHLSDATLEEVRRIGGKNEGIIRIGTSMMRPCNKLVELWERKKPAHTDYQFHIVPFDDGIDSLTSLLSSLGGNKVKVIDFNGYYDATTFNMCEQMGYLMGTMDLWENLHPSLVTLPVAWDFTMPYGIMYVKEPSKTVKEFISAIEKN